MVTQRQKEEIYKLFEQGFTPSQVLIKLNIPAERRIVSGCYTHYKQLKYNSNTEENNLLEESKFDKLISQEISLIEERNKKLENLLNDFIHTGEALISYVAMSKHECNYSSKVSQCEFLREVLLHKIEDGNYSIDTCKQIEKISKLRRQVKNYGKMNQSIIDDYGKFQSIIAKAKRCINSNECRQQGSFELFTEHRMNKLKEDTYKQILDEIMEG